MSLFNDKEYINMAIIDGIINSEADIENFIEGDKIGFEAIKNHYDVKLARQLPIMDRMKTNLIKSIEEKLKRREFDGKSVDSVIVESSQFLGERVSLQRELIDMSNREDVLSEDKLYTLPFYRKTETLMREDDFTKVLSHFKSLSEKPRTRNAIASEIEQAMIDRYTLDAIIQALVGVSAI